MNLETFTQARKNHLGMSQAWTSPRPPAKRRLARAGCLLALLSGLLSFGWAVSLEQPIGLGRAEAAAQNVSLAGVHWYSGDSGMLDGSVPAGERGWNVEVIFNAEWCDGDRATDPGGVRGVAQTARDHGLVNIIRVDYRNLVAVPTNANEYAGWASDFIKCTHELADVASVYIAGNEPNIEGNITPGHYAAAFNYLYARRGEMPPGTQLLTTFNSPFTPTEWMFSMASALNGVDGFSFHTGGARPHCQDPRRPCSHGSWPFDGGFRYYRDVIHQIPSKWWSKPVYITEINTYTGDAGSEPQNNYPANWINQAFEEIRNYNATRGSRPPVRAVAWFVDRPQSWPEWSLRNIPAARTDMAEEFKNPANRGSAPGPTATPVPNPTLPPGKNVARGVAWQASSVFSPVNGGDKAVDGVVSVASKWTSNGASPQSWLALDLGATYRVTGFVVRHAGAAGEAAYFNTQAFRLESAPSFNGPWTVLASVNNASQGNSISSVTLATPASARFVRLTITDAGIDNYARIPEFEVYAQGSLSPTPTSTPAPAGSLTNGGFEGAAQGNGVGEAWRAFASGGAGAAFAVVTDPVHGGARAQRIRSQPAASDQFAGVFQTVATEPGRGYTIRAWNRVNLPGGSGWPIVGRLGIDLSGGTDYSASSVSWVEFEAPEDGVGGWVFGQTQVTGNGARLTIFLQSWRKWPTGGASDVWFDDVEVIPSGASLPPGQNIAQGKAWQASSVFSPVNGGDKAVDGVVSVASKWTSNGASPQSWLALDLGATYRVTGFVVRHAGAAGEAAYFNTQAFRLESAPSFNGPWTALASVNNASQTSDVSTVILATPVSARFVRLTITDAGIDNYARIPEFEVYAQATADLGGIRLR